MRAAAIALLVMLGGCASACPSSAVERTVSMRIDAAPDGDGYTGADLADALVSAAAMWAPVGGHLVLDDDAPMALRCATWGMDGAAATTNAAGIAVDCLYGVNQAPERKTRLLAHELGHAFGLLHVEDPAAVMWWRNNDGPEALSPADVAEYERSAN